MRSCEVCGWRGDVFECGDCLKRCMEAPIDIADDGTATVDVLFDRWRQMTSS